MTRSSKSTPASPADRGAGACSRSGDDSLSPALARATFRHALDAMLVSDDSRRFVDANRAASVLLGACRDKLVTCALDDFVAPEARRALDARWRRFLTSGRDSDELELLTTGGCVRAVELRASARVLPGRHLLVLRELSGRATREAQRVEQARDLLPAVLEHVADGVCVVDDQQCISFVNPAGAAILGYRSPEELVGQPVHRTMRVVPAGHPGPSVEVCGRRAHPDHQDEWFVRNDGSLVAVTYRSAPLGRAGFVVAFRDVTGGVHIAQVGHIAEGTDVTEGRRAELRWEREHEFLDAVLESLDTGIVACDASGTLTLFNRATREMHGLAPEQVGPEYWASHYDLFMADGVTPMAPEDLPLFRALRGERVRDVELVIAPATGSPRKVLCNGQLIERGGCALGAVVAMHDITDRRRAEAQLAHLALHDALTGLPNRALLLDRLAHSLALASRNGSEVVVLFADLDNFKLVNDSLGYRAGDSLLHAVANRLDASIRVSDTVGRPGVGSVARPGGDEFVIICEVYTHEHGAIRLAQRITKALAAPFVIDGEEAYVNASIGIALSGDNSDPASLLRDAEAAMHRAKTRGRGSSQLFDESVHGRATDRLQREKALRRAIERNQLRLHYQPIVSLPERRIVAVEALMRWQHPERGLLPPADFIELAEASGLIVVLGEWVLGEACLQIARWEQSLGTEVAPQVSVNISARQLVDPEIVGKVLGALSAAGASPARLGLEITETVLMEVAPTPVATLEAIKRLGSPLMLDDFGTGYSSLSYLDRLPLDTLKLDSSFVAPLGVTGEGRAIVAAVVELAHALGMTIVAEGVETENQLRVLEELGCDLAQGYLFGRPLPPDEITSMLEAQLTGTDVGR